MCVRVYFISAILPVDNYIVSVNSLVLAAGQIFTIKQKQTHLFFCSVQNFRVNLFRNNLRMLKF